MLYYYMPILYSTRVITHKNVRYLHVLHTLVERLSTMPNRKEPSFHDNEAR